MIAPGTDEQDKKCVRKACFSTLLVHEQERPICMYRLLFANDFRRVLGSRSYVSGLLIDTRVVALMGLRTRRDLISGQVDYDLMGRQTLGA